MSDRAITAAEANSDGSASLVKRGSAGVLTLARPARRNALDAAMRATLSAAYAELARDPIIYAAVLRSAVPGVFCAGIDLAEVAALAETRPQDARDLLAEALRLCWQHECFTKPTIALMDGLVMGNGFGLGLHGTHRIAAEGYAFAVPETGLGLVPAGGTSHMLARLPDCVGLYLALTGSAIGRADAFRLGLVTHCLPAHRFEDVEARLADADPVDEVLDAMHADPGPGELEPLQPLIARCFSGPTVAEILARLEAEAGPHAAWAQLTAAGLRTRPSLALAATVRVIGEAGALDLRGLLMLEHRLIARLIARPGFAAGARAAVDGRDAISSPADVEEASPALVSSLFADDPALALPLPARSHMQGRR